jgi:hypothetical protein
MDNKPNNVTFALFRVTTEQFAIIEEKFSDNGNIKLGTNLRFGADDKQKQIVVFASFIFEEDDQPFLKIEAACHFRIEDKAWGQMLSNEDLTLTVPNGFMCHLGMLTVGTARGILHAKTEKTRFNRFLIPTINVTELIKGDTVFNFNAQ